VETTRQWARERDESRIDFAIFSPIRIIPFIQGVRGSERRRRKRRRRRYNRRIGCIVERGKETEKHGREQSECCKLQTPNDHLKDENERKRSGVTASNVIKHHGYKKEDNKKDLTQERGSKQQRERRDENVSEEKKKRTEERLWWW